MSITSALSGLYGVLSGQTQQEKMLNKQIQYQEDAQQKQNEANLLITQEYNKAQKELAQSQNEYNTQLWHMQNEYNSPKATMQRLVEAGINPRAYQQIGQFANAGAPAPASTPEQKMREYTEPKLSSTEARMKRLDLYNAFQERKLRALELTSDVFKARANLKETRYQFDKKLAEEQRQFNLSLQHKEDILDFNKGKWSDNLEYLNKRLEQSAQQFGAMMMLKEDIGKAELAKHGIKVVSKDGRWYFVTNKDSMAYQDFEARLKEIQARTSKVISEEDYLELKKDLETINTGSSLADTILKIFFKLLK